MAEYALTPTARDGLRHILEHVDERFGSRVAERVLGQLVAAFEFLADNPGAGHNRDDLVRDKRIRFWSVGPMLIAYRAKRRSLVEFLFVERGERDWQRILGEDGC